MFLISMSTVVIVAVGQLLSISTRLERIQYLNAVYIILSLKKSNFALQSYTHY